MEPKILRLVQSSENVFLSDLGVPQSLFLLSGQCCILYLVSDQLSARESRDLAPIKLVSTLHFNLYPRGLAEPPETTNIVRLGPGSYPSQSHSRSLPVL